MWWGRAIGEVAQRGVGDHVSTEAGLHERLVEDRFGVLLGAADGAAQVLLAPVLVAAQEQLGPPGILASAVQGSRARAKRSSADAQEMPKCARHSLNSGSWGGTGPVAHPVFKTGRPW